MTDCVLRHDIGEVVVLTLNAPKVRNAISLDMRERLLEALRDASASPKCRGIVLTGAEANFCAGGQLQQDTAASGPDPQRTRRNIAILHDIVRILSAGPKPTVAAVEGYAYGAGLSLAAACDYLVAGDSARFCASFAKVGLMADSGLIWSLPQRVGPARARDIMLTGRVVQAEEAGVTGLANTIVPAGQALDAAVKVAGAFTQMAPLALASMKAVLARGPNSLEEVLAAESDEQPMLTLSQDYAEGRAAFMERRAPAFRGL